MESTTRISARARKEAGLLVQKMLGLAVDLQPFYKLARDNAVIGPLVEQFAGVRPPRFPTVFEGLVNSIACQQVSLDVGIVLLNRLSERFGAQFVTRNTVLHAFPTPADLADVPEESIRELGFSHQKTRAIQELSTHVADTTVDLTRLEGMTNKEAVAYLSRIRGIGRWSAEYVLLRGLGRLDTFPGDDIGAQNNLQRLFHLRRKAGLRPHSTVDIAVASIRRRCLFSSSARQVARERGPYESCRHAGDHPTRACARARQRARRPTRSGRSVPEERRVPQAPRQVSVPLRPAADRMTERPFVGVAEAAATSGADVLGYLDSAATGLADDAEAARRRVRVGPNAVRTHRVSAVAVLVRQLRSPLLALLAAAAIVSYFVGERSDAVVIAVILTVSVGLGFANEYRAERAGAALHDNVRHQAVVVRGGIAGGVDVVDLVPGDVVRLELGMVVPADVRLLVVRAWSVTSRS